MERSENGVNFAAVPSPDIRLAAGARMEIEVPLGYLGCKGSGETVAFLVQVMEAGIEKERYPERGLIEFSGPSSQFKLVNWFV
jgi:hypothetical protein